MSEKDGIKANVATLNTLIDSISNEYAYKYGVMAGVEYARIMDGRESRFMRKRQAQTRLTKTIYAKATEKGNLKEYKQNPNIPNSPLLVDRLEVIEVEHLVMAQDKFFTEMMKDVSDPNLDKE